jgi:spermidine synthase
MPETPRVYRSRDAQTLTLQFGDGAIQSRVQRNAPHTLLLDYTRTMLAALQWHPAPRRIAMVGLGGGTMLRFIHSHMPASTLTVLEIDPKVIALRSEFELPADDARLQVLCVDGAAHLARTEGAFDALLIDGFDHEGLPEVLCSQAFYDDCVHALAADGLLIVNLPLADPRCPLITERLRLASGQLPLLLDDADSEGGNRIALASRQAWPRWRTPGRLRAPAGMGPEAWGQLTDARLRLRDVLNAQNAADNG